MEESKMEPHDGQGQLGVKAAKDPAASLQKYRGGTNYVSRDTPLPSGLSGIRWKIIARAKTSQKNH